MKFTIIGAGAIGGVIAGYLAYHENNVTLVDINQEHIDTINKKGLTIETTHEPIVVRIDTCMLNQLIQLSDKLDVIILAVKSQHTKHVINEIKHLIGKNTVVISMQNGLNEHIIANMIGQDRTIGSFVNLFADYLEPGRIQYGGVGSLYIGELDGKITNRLLDIQNRLKAWGNVQITSNIFGYLWSKLAYGAILTATATVDETMEYLIANHEYRELFVEISTEVLQVAEQLHIQTEAFDDWDPAIIYSPNNKRDWDRIHEQFDLLVKRLQTYKKKKSGIWRDLAVHKRKTEVPNQLEPVIEKGEQFQLDMPLIRKLLNMITELETGKREMNYQNLDKLKTIINP
ncbi:ketopantoate reductase family protein [Oceanobacillus locisalsi]|uniref:2-dehydropantoate 2-reductase n=1 Tax=Oceanobacillus locisalsi TaxID=546107 RepID=A0ABW3NMK8_9BACI